MEDQKKITPFKIPPRDAFAAREPALPAVTGPSIAGSSVSDLAAAGPSGAGSIGEVPASGAKFAEIEIESNANHVSAAEKALRFFSSVTPPVPIEQKAHDPIRLKFFDMRRLATDRPFARDDSELFYKQAKFMEEFSDDYDGNAQFFMYYPYYQHMGYEQLRTYFTWRTGVRKGEISATSVSYVFLYVYELLNNIGVDNQSDGLEKLIAVWDTCLELAPALENYMPGWFKDYHIYYNPPHSFAEFVKARGLNKYYSVSLLFDVDANNSLELWNSISGYNIKKSQFFNDGNEQLFRDCFNAVLDSIRALCTISGTSLEELFIYSISKRMPWRPFKHALFHNWLLQDDRNIEMPGQERYYCKNNLWSTNLPMYYSTQKEFVGYIIKKTEACLRQAVNYKYKLKTEPDIRYHEYFQELKELDGRRAGLDSAIEKAVSDFQRDRTRTVVTVDSENLARIRREALGTQEKLTVPDGAEHSARPARSILDTPSAQGGPDTPPVHSILDAPPAQGGPDTAPVRSILDAPPVQGSPGALPARDDDGWGAFGEALSTIELEALTLILHSDGNIRAFADENGVMLEVLADGINEKAADFIGDSLLETDGGMRIYDEYIDTIAEMLG